MPLYGLALPPLRLRPLADFHHLRRGKRAPEPLPEPVHRAPTGLSAGTSGAPSAWELGIGVRGFLSTFQAPRESAAEFVAADAVLAVHEQPERWEPLLEPQRHRHARHHRGMHNHLAHLARLHGRTLELAHRIHRDTQLLTELQQELSKELDHLWETLSQPPPARPPSPPPVPRILRLPQVVERVGVRRATIYNMVREGRFPPARKLGPNAVGWASEDIEEWVRSREVGGGRPRPGRPRRT